MSISFKDYVVIADALVQTELDEGRIWDAIKKKMGGKASDVDIEAEVTRLKGLDADDVKKIKQTQASREFHARKAKMAQAGGAKQPLPSMRTVRPGTASNDDWEDAFSPGDKRINARRDRLGEGKAPVDGFRIKIMNLSDHDTKSVLNAFKNEFASVSTSKPKGKTSVDVEVFPKNKMSMKAVSEIVMGLVGSGHVAVFEITEVKAPVVEGQINEAQDFVVTYSLRGSDAKKKTKIKGKTVIDVKRKFADSHYGAKLIAVEPAKEAPKKLESVEEDVGPLGPRT